MQKVYLAVFFKQIRSHSYLAKSKRRRSAPTKKPWLKSRTPQGYQISKKSYRDFCHRVTRISILSNWRLTMRKCFHASRKKRCQHLFTFCCHGTRISCAVQASNTTHCSGVEGKILFCLAIIFYFPAATLLILWRPFQIVSDWSTLSRDSSKVFPATCIENVNCETCNLALFLNVLCFVSPGETSSWVRRNEVFRRSKNVQVNFDRF